MNDHRSGLTVGVAQKGRPARIEAVRCHVAQWASNNLSPGALMFSSSRTKTTHVASTLAHVYTTEPRNVCVIAYGCTQ